MTVRRSIAIWSVLALVVAVVIFFGVDTVFHKASAAKVTRTATVETGTVSSTESASGNVTPAEDDDLGFSTSGTVAAIDVSVGDRVQAGQVLATLQKGTAQATLAAAEDQLQAARDNLATTEAGGETPPQQAEDAQQLADASSQITTAQDSLDSAETTQSSDDKSLQAAVTTAKDKLAAAQKACSASGGSPTGTSGSGGSGKPGSGTSTSSSTSPCSEVSTDEQAVSQAESNLSETESKDTATVQQDQSQLTQAKQSYTNDELQIEAKRYVSPATIDQDNASIIQQEQTITQDQKALNGTMLTAPFAGTVVAVNGSVGSTVSGSGDSSASTSSTSSSGTGGEGTGGSSTAGSSSSASSSAGTGSTSSTSSSSSGSGFITLANLSSLQVVAGFAEADATKIAVGQPASISFDALPDTTAAGKVVAVSTVPTVVSDVVTYDVTVDLTDPPATVKDGMSTTVVITTESKSNVLELPTSAITTTGTFSTVQLLEKDGKTVTTRVTTGLVGTDTTQIESGLTAGEKVVEPTASVSAATGTTGSTSTRTGFGGLGGGGFGGLGGGGFGG